MENEVASNENATVEAPAHPRGINDFTTHWTPYVLRGLEPGEPAPEGDADTMIPVLADGEIAEISMADYLPGVVAAEMPASFEPEALRAQAVAARTYILDRMAHPVEAHPDAAVCDDPGCCCAYVSEDEMRENWGADYRRNQRRIRNAVRSTDGMVLTWEGEPIRAVFHSSSGGMTETSAALWGEVPYLVSVPSPETAADVPGFETTVTVSAADAAQALGIEPPEDPAQWLGEIRRDNAGRVETITISRCGRQTLQWRFKTGISCFM